MMTESKHIELAYIFEAEADEDQSCAN